jgi:surface antigen
MLKRAYPLLLIAMLIANPAQALPLHEPAPREHWECVPFARELSGVQIYGDAHTWWAQAEGKFKRGNRPKIGAVLSFIPQGAMRLGHVATVSEIVDAHTVRVTHANWSPINGRRGQIERNVDIIDVSENGDWTKVRVWFAPSASLGTTEWSTHGFIYPGGSPTAAPPPQTPKLAPKLSYAPLLDLTIKPVRPTGKLNYLRALLPKL